MGGTPIWILLQIVIAILAICATIYAARYAYQLQHRKTIIGIRQDIRQVVHPGMLVKPEIVFKSGSRDFRYENIFIIQSQLRNRTNCRHKEFHVNVCVEKASSNIVFASCRGHAAAHDGIIRQHIDFDNPAKVVDIDLNPFNWRDAYDLTLYVSCTSSQRITKDDIKYDSKEFHQVRSEIN